MQQAVDFLMSHLIFVFVIVFLMFFGAAGIQISQINNYVHEANQIVSRYGGLTKDAAIKLKSVSDNQYHGRFIVTTLETKNGDVVMPTLNKDGLSYMDSNALRRNMQENHMTVAGLSEKMANAVFDNPEIEFDMKNNNTPYNHLQASISMPSQLIKVNMLRNNLNRINKLSYNTNNPKLYAQSVKRIKDLKDELKDMEAPTKEALRDYEKREIEEILSKRKDSASSYPLGLEWREAVGKCLNTKQDKIFNTDSVPFGDQFSYTVWIHFNVMNMRKVLVPRTYTITNDTRQGTIGSSN